MELLNHGEKEVIRKFAAGDRDLRAAAVKVYEEACGRINASRDREWAAEHRESVHMSFMREITSKCPDLMLRHQARLDLVGADNMPKATWPKEMK